MSILRRNERTLSLLTWNVWFGLEKPHRRWTELLSIVGSLRPDVIAFQEVTDPFLSLWRATPWMKKAYTLSDPEGASIDHYGTVIATRCSQERVSVHPLESHMGRKLVVVEADVGGTAWSFASVHLESLRQSAAARGQQLNQILEILSPLDHVVLMGDMNFCSTWKEENDRIPTDFVDVWPTVRSDEGYTVDYELNPIRSREGRGFKRVRYDRILVRSKRARPVKAQLTGTKIIKGEVPELVPSDHFGVLGRLSLTTSQ